MGLPAPHPRQGLTVAIGGGWDAIPTINSNGFTATVHNGPVCHTCGARYVGYHRCSREALARRIAELARLMEVLPADAPSDRTAGCPCRKENGGTGVCGCVMGGPSITCRVG